MNTAASSLQVWYLHSIGEASSIARQVTITPLPFRVGRSSDAQLWIPSSSVSKIHAEFFERDGQLYLRDLGSTNGTFVNAERIRGDVAVQSGDIVHFSTLGFQIDCWAGNLLGNTIEENPFQTALAAEIDERRRAEELLWNSQARWRAVFDNAADGIITLNESLQVETYNTAAQRLFGYSCEQIVGLQISLLMPGVELDSSNAAAPQAGRRIETLCRRSDGSMFLADVSLGTVPQSKSHGYIAIIRDITRQRRDQQELEEAKRAAESASHAKDEFLANMSHEIRTPITAILGFSDLLIHDQRLQNEFPNWFESAQTVYRNGEHLLSLINDVLDLSKIEAGRLLIESIRCSPLEIVRDVCQLMSLKASEKDLTLDVSFRTDIPVTAVTDPTRIKQVLINLVGNAVKFTPRGSVQITVDIHSSGHATMLAVEVTDTGIGMTSAQIDRLFQPFTQADASTTRRFGGTGLGLVISKRIVEALGGQVSVVSQSGEGSTFRVLLPLIVPTESAWLTPSEALTALREPLPRPQISAGPQLTGRILVADDGIDNQRLLRQILTRAGADVTVAENGLEAVRAWQAANLAGCPFALILMDMQMPELDGYQATRRLRELGATIPIIALTAHAMTGDRDLCLQAGCDDYLTKPFERKRLLETLRKRLLETPLLSIDPHHDGTLRTNAP
ncbi:PAS/PAC sensor hybrid histidine kinase [Pirellula staleyi DSM 6068]|uniref:histidine kinase n=1 Tax=Pirellula staleyi (strain ATCC 27377 / DSM 6068 / ICPB 4128) TaxID=530564 RepID=D2R6W8_PIRSD|nr:ATP-binding protein [Pirellula staleyi]ADB19171.1 PAS/PAC sensor hybrid histidine kinase [Pirellula staleyi DSM 6068]